jgi:MGT family glycosyltransferase
MHVGILTTAQHGHLNPHIPIMHALRAKGCKVTCLLMDADGETLSEQRRAALDPIEARVVGEVNMAAWTGRPEALRHLLDTTHLADDVADAVRALSPDFVLVDSSPVTASAVAGAHASGVPYGLSCPNLGMIAPRRLREARWAFDEIVREYLLRYGVRWSAETHSARSPLMNLAPTIHELVGADAVLDDGVTLVGLPGAWAVRGDEVPFSDWQRLDASKPLVYLSFGTIFYNHPELLRRIVVAASKLGLQVVASVGDIAEKLAGVSDDVILAKYLPQREMLRRASVFVTHGGYNSVAESIRAGTPMLVIPLAIDQPLSAHYVERAGFGCAIRPEEVTEGSVASALETLLDARRGFGDRIRAVGGVCGDSARTTADLVVSQLQMAG